MLIDWTLLLDDAINSDTAALFIGFLVYILM